MIYMIYMYICTYMYIYSHIYIYIPTLGGYTPYVSPRLRRELAQVPNSTLERLLAGGIIGAWGNPVVTKYYPLVI